MNLDKIMELMKKGGNGTRREIVDYYRPNKISNVIAFILSVGFVISLLFIFGLQFSLVYILILIIGLLLSLYYGVNLFTKKGFVTPIYKDVPIEDEESDNDDNQNEEEEVQ